MTRPPLVRITVDDDGGEHWETTPCAHCGDVMAWMYTDKDEPVCQPCWLKAAGIPDFDAFISDMLDKHNKLIGG